MNRALFARSQGTVLAAAVIEILVNWSPTCTTTSSTHEHASEVNNGLPKQQQYLNGYAITHTVMCSGTRFLLSPRDAFS